MIPVLILNGGPNADRIHPEEGMEGGGDLNGTKRRVNTCEGEEEDGLRVMTVLS